MEGLFERETLVLFDTFFCASPCIDLVQPVQLLALSSRSVKQPPVRVYEEACSPVEDSCAVLSPSWLTREDRFSAQPGMNKRTLLSWLPGSVGHWHVRRAVIDLSARVDWRRMVCHVRFYHGTSSPGATSRR